MYDIISSLFSKKYFFSHTDPHNNTCTVQKYMFFLNIFYVSSGVRYGGFQNVTFLLLSNQRHSNRTNRTMLTFVATFQYTCVVHMSCVHTHTCTRVQQTNIIKYTYTYIFYFLHTYIMCT